MKTLLIPLLFFSSLLQGGGQPINIPIPITSFSEGYGSSLSQDLGVTPAHFQEFKPGYTIDGVYTLSFSVANNFPNYPGYYKAKLSFGSQELCEPPGWGTRTDSMVTFVCPSPGYLIVDHSLSCDSNPCTVGPPQGNANLFFTATVNGWTVLFKNASLSFTPN